MVKKHDIQSDMNAIESALVEQIFNDPESKRNLVGFFELAMKVHMRCHPEIYRRGMATKSND